VEVRHDGAADRLRPRLDRRQDLTAQRHGLLALGVDPGRIYVDHGLTGTNRERPGLREALAACREGDTLVVTKLDWLARSLPDARAIAEELTLRQVRLSLGGSVYVSRDPAAMEPPEGGTSAARWLPCAVLGRAVVPRHEHLPHRARPVVSCSPTLAAAGRSSPRCTAPAPHAGRPPRSPTTQAQPPPADAPEQDPGAASN
jgi:hypothetical protein